MDGDSIFRVVRITIRCVLMGGKKKDQSCLVVSCWLKELLLTSGLSVLCLPVFLYRVWSREGLRVKIIVAQTRITAYVLSVSDAGKWR